ncbi:hypothetical protein [Pseudomonas sp.]|uniref:hypothetical protein n=1 Tax=Pseudomonas sp. TaxID=306 RepID=UPI003D0BAEA9
MNYVSASALNLVVHAAFCFAFVVVNDWGLTLYKQFVGEATSRGYAPGGATRLALGVFAIANAAIALSPWKILKGAWVAGAIVFLTFHLLPTHPLRAVFYIALTGVLSMAAIVLAAGIVQAMAARSKSAEPGHESGTGMNV